MIKKSLIAIGILATAMAQSSIAEQAPSTKQTTATTTTPESSLIKVQSEPTWEINWPSYIWAANLEADITQGDASGSGTLDFDDM